jgi:hypothetical protein
LRAGRSCTVRTPSAAIYATSRAIGVRYGPVSAFVGGSLTEISTTNRAFDADNGKFPSPGVLNRSLPAFSLPARPKRLRHLRNSKNPSAVVGGLTPPDWRSLLPFVSSRVLTGLTISGAPSNSLPWLPLSEPARCLAPACLSGPAGPIRKCTRLPN